MPFVCGGGGGFLFVVFWCPSVAALCEGMAYRRVLRGPGVDINRNYLCHSCTYSKIDPAHNPTYNQPWASNYGSLKGRESNGGGVGNLRLTP